MANSPSKTIKPKQSIAIKIEAVGIKSYLMKTAGKSKLIPNLSELAILANITCS